MRRRLIAALVGVAVVTLLMYATPRAFAVDDLVRRQEKRALQRTADLMDQIIGEHLATGDPVDDRFVRQLVAPGEQLVVELADGTVARSGPAPAGETVAVERALGDGGRATLLVSTDSVDERLADALFARVWTGLAVIALAVLLAAVLSRRLAAPFTALAAYTDRVEIDDGTSAPRSSIPEADRLADALDRSRERIAAMVRREREFSANASHQLRTPLTALRLRLEDLRVWPETTPPVRDEVDAVLSEADRLGATIADLLELARSGGIGEPREVDLDRLVAESVARCSPRYAAVGRSLTVRPSGGDARATTSAGAVEQILDVLLENALVHGAGGVVTQVRSGGDGITISVTDEGRLNDLVGADVFERSVRSATSTGTGIGLALARDLAVLMGARLEVAEVAPTTFELVVPNGRHGGPVGAR